MSLVAGYYLPARRVVADGLAFIGGKQPSTCLDSSAYLSTFPDRVERVPWFAAITDEVHFEAESFQLLC